VLQVVHVDLSSMKCCCSGPKHPLDRVLVSNVRTDFLSCLQDSESPRVSERFHAAQCRLVSVSIAGDSNILSAVLLRLLSVVLFRSIVNN